VKTSGLSETIPGGIMVGWLVSEGADPDGLYRMGRVLPAVDFSDLSSVFVLTPEGGGR
jgi:cell shape-determining protein MreC